MTRRTVNSGTNTKEKKKCINCGLERALDNYISGVDKDGKCYVCNKCRRLNKFSGSLDGLQAYCNLSHRNFSSYLWNSCMEWAESSDKNKEQMKGMNDKEKSKFLEQKAINQYFSKMNMPGIGDITDSQKEEKDNEQIIVPKNLEQKWAGFEANDCLVLEEKFQRYCKSFSIENESQFDYLKKACVASLNGDKAMAAGNAKEAETWMKVFDTAMKSGKLQPVQMNSADMLSGVVTFSQFFELVEKQGFIPPMPNVIRDDIDYAIWCFINYNRDLMDFPPIPLGEVKDIMKYEYLSGQEILSVPDKDSGDE